MTKTETRSFFTRGSKNGILLGVDRSVSMTVSANRALGSLNKNEKVNKVSVRPMFLPIKNQRYNFTS